MPSEYGVGTRRGGIDSVQVDDGCFDYNERIHVESSQKHSRDFSIKPIGGVVNQDGPFTFAIEPMVDSYLQLNRARLWMKCQVVKGDGTLISHYEDVVAPVNLLGAVFWKDVEVTLNGQPFNGASSVHAGMKAMLETLLSCDADARDSHLNASFLHMDSPGHFASMCPSTEDFIRNFLTAVRQHEVGLPAFPAEIQPGEGEAPIDREDVGFLEEAGGLQDEAETPGLPDVPLPEAEKQRRRRNVMRAWFRGTVGVLSDGLAAINRDRGLNIGFNNRYCVVTGSTSWDMYSPITHDFFRLNNHIGPSNRIELKLTPYPNNFLLNSFLGPLPNKGYKIRLLDLRLHLRCIERKERIPTPLKEKYLMNETQMHKYVLARNTPSTSFRIHNGGVLPKTVIVTMVTTRAADGDYERNPFTFHHHFARRISLMVNGQKVPADDLEMDFEQANPEIARVYHWMYENTGALEGERGNIVSWPAFSGGTFIVPFDLTPDKCNGLHNHEADYGYIDLNIDFAKPLEESVYVFYELVFNKVVVNDKITNTVLVLDIEK